MQPSSPINTPRERPQTAGLPEPTSTLSPQGMLFPAQVEINPEKQRVTLGKAQGPEGQVPNLEREDR